MRRQIHIIFYFNLQLDIQQKIRISKLLAREYLMLDRYMKLDKKFPLTTTNCGFLCNPT